MLDLRVRHEAVEGDDEGLLAPLLHLEGGQPQVRVAPVKEPAAQSRVQRGRPVDGRSRSSLAELVEVSLQVAGLLVMGVIAVVLMHKKYVASIKRLRNFGLKVNDVKYLLRGPANVAFLSR